MKFKDITGKKFGQLVVLSFIERKNRHTFWNCLCDCGNKTIVTNNNLSQNHTKSCGCLAKKIARKRFTTHGFRKTRFWRTWICMKYRCEKSYHSGFSNYGGRGIKCLWKSFNEFKKDMYKSYLHHIKKFGEKNTTIDRIDNNGNYCKENCRWATQKQQARNRRNNHFITFRNKTKTLIEWAEEFNLHYRLLLQRIKRDKWPIEKALKTPIRHF